MFEAERPRDHDLLDNRGFSRRELLRLVRFSHVRSARARWSHFCLSKPDNFRRTWNVRFWHFRPSGQYQRQKRVQRRLQLHRALLLSDLRRNSRPNHGRNKRQNVFFALPRWLQRQRRNAAKRRKSRWLRFGPFFFQFPVFILLFFSISTAPAPAREKSATSKRATRKKKKNKNATRVTFRCSSSAFSQFSLSF